MNELLKKKELNKNITTQQFIEDMDCLFENMKEVYGMYEFFGEEQFRCAKEEIIQELYPFGFDHARELVRRVLSFIKDGHFYIGKTSEAEIQYPYAVRYGTFEGVDYIDCKKCYYDTPEENSSWRNFVRLFSMRNPFMY